MLDEIKEIGFDAVELPVFEIDVEKYAKWGKHLDNAGLARTAVTVRGADDNPMSPDPKIRRKGIDANKAALDCCQAAGVEALVGPYHSALGCFSGAGPTKDEWNWAVESMTAGRRARRKVQRDAGAGIPQPLRVLFVEHGRRRRPLLPRRGPSALQNDVRHVPLAHRGEEHAGGHPRARRTAWPTSTFPKTTAARRARATSAGPKPSTRCTKSATTT